MAARKRTTAKQAKAFYAEALSEAERSAYFDALAVAGLDEEIAVLRLCLRKVIGDRREDLPLMFRGIDLLVKAVSAKYKLGPGSEAQLLESLERVLAEEMALEEAASGQPPREEVRA